MTTHPWLEHFVASVLYGSTPPSVPFRLADWVGFAFDRNRHEDLAPDYIWTAWLEVQRIVGGDQPLIAYSGSTLDRNSKTLSIRPSLDHLRSYWTTDDRFLSDHYFVDPSRRWIVRLDQDVTLFGGERSFVQQVCNVAGGIGFIVEDMIKDFDPGPEDKAGLRKYINYISKGLT